MQLEPGTSTLLTMEQQFAIRKYKQEISNVPREQLEKLFIEIVRQKYAQMNLFQKMMRQEKLF